MGPAERQRMLSALAMLVMALFVSSGFASAGRARRLLRIAAVTLFAFVALAAVVEAALWITYD